MQQEQDQDSPNDHVQGFDMAALDGPASQDQNPDLARDFARYLLKDRSLPRHVRAFGHALLTRLDEPEDAISR